MTVSAPAEPDQPEIAAVSAKAKNRIDCSQFPKLAEMVRKVSAILPDESGTDF
jgi:hypothetical protein